MASASTSTSMRLVSISMDENFHLTSLQHVVRRTMHSMCKSMCLCTNCNASHSATMLPQKVTSYRRITWSYGFLSTDTFLTCVQLQCQYA